MKLQSLVLAAILAVSLVMGGTPARATFHLMQIEQVIGGVDGDASVQAIQLRMRGVNQQFVSFSMIRVWDATGSNPVVVIAPATNVANGGAGVHILIASANFSAATSPTAVPDFVMTNVIPTSYLAAGSMTFEDATGATVYWRLSWGGASYTGPKNGALFNDADGKFGPPWAGPLPSSTTQALRFTRAATDLHVSNATDYVLTVGDAVVTNNAGTSFTVQSLATGIRPGDAGALALRNIPNPFNPSTDILFTMPRAGRASLEVFDGQGRLVVRLFDGVLPAGPNRVQWVARDARGNPMATGMYFYRLAAPGATQTRKMILLK